MDRVESLLPDDERAILDREFSSSFPLWLAFPSFGWCGVGKEASVEDLLVEIVPHLAVIGANGHCFFFTELLHIVQIATHEENLGVVPMFPDFVNLVVAKRFWQEVQGLLHVC